MHSINYGTIICSYFIIWHPSLVAFWKKALSGIKYKRFSILWQLRQTFSLSILVFQSVIYCLLTTTYYDLIDVESLLSPKDFRPGVNRTSWQSIHMSFKAFRLLSNGSTSSQLLAFIPFLQFDPLELSIVWSFSKLYSTTQTSSPGRHPHHSMAVCILWYE